MRICAQSSEDTRDVCTLQGVGNLNAKESEAQIPQFPKGKIRFLFHLVIRFFSRWMFLSPRCTSDN